ncbi:uncharacterized protein BDZ99DRAFT_479590 [Mytilinidion resinicola]|uniref:Uncharacterized protein n=1 Tax=Mytilinidion resinicola TaxID=574789 RepID=A0A6A6YBY5_9PEZI|nr:uncharacterized protein BDZ99DRAFT_479590 [Mytilinidion resinicola]KAF2806322.1 hypothetical protein BDZ99DRAFT_479590 [Mytilinidion resinicola]
MATWSLSCFRGQPRALAAKDVLPPGSRRWTVDLYLSDKAAFLDLHCDDLKTTLIEEHSCEKKPDDGEIYRKIREYQGYGGARNPYFEKRWWALLYGISDHKFDNMKQIIRYHDFRAARYPARCSWACRRDALGLNAQMFGMRCHEEILHYLDNIRESWTKIFRKYRQAMLKMRSDKIFSAFTDQEREVIWTDILSASVDRLISSLSSFFTDVNYLEDPADRVKTLMELWPGETVSSALERIFRDVNQETD